MELLKCSKYTTIMICISLLIWSKIIHAADMSDIKHLNAKLDTLQVELRKGESATQRIAEIQGDIVQLEADWDKRKKGLSKGDEISSVIKLIKDYAQEVGATVVSCGRSEKVVQIEHSEIPVKLIVTSSLSQLVRLLKDLGNFGVILNSLSLKTARGKMDKIECEMEISVVSAKSK